MSEQTFPVECGENTFSVISGQTLLDAAIEHNIELPHSCRSGLCQTCLVKVQSGQIPATAQSGLSDNQKMQNLALACQLHPTDALRIELGTGVKKHKAEVIEHQMLNDRVLRLRLQSDIDWYPGQYLTLWKDDKVGRPYSIASLPEDGFLEFHIRIYSDGAVSSWLKNSVQPGSVLQINEAIGNCFYTEAMANKPILLVGYGTGLAPLYGILRDALGKHHRQPVHLYFAGRDPGHLYYQQELQQLSESHQSFHWETLISQQSDATAMYQEIKTDVLSRHSKLQEWCVFLCGAPELVKGLQKACFLHGASLADIHADPFVSGQ